MSKDKRPEDELLREAKRNEVPPETVLPLVVGSPELSAHTTQVVARDPELLQHISQHLLALGLESGSGFIVQGLILGVKTGPASKIVRAGFVPKMKP